MVRLRDVIKIVDEDILNAMAYTLWKMSYQEVMGYRTKEYNDFVNEFVDLITSPPKEYKILCFDTRQDQYNYHVKLMCDKFNNFRHSIYITDMFLVSEVYDDHFKVSLLNEFDRREFQRLNKLQEITEFLNGLQFPYDWELKKFYCMECGFDVEK